MIEIQQKITELILTTSHISCIKTRTKYKKMNDRKFVLKKIPITFSQGCTCVRNTMPWTSSSIFIFIEFYFKVKLGKILYPLNGTRRVLEFVFHLIYFANLCGIVRTTRWILSIQHSGCVYCAIRRHTQISVQMVFFDSYLAYTKFHTIYTRFGCVFFFSISLKIHVYLPLLIGIDRAGTNAVLMINS